MKRKIAFFLCPICLASMLSVPVYADQLSGGSDWHVEFSSEKEMVSNFSSDNFADVLDYMQPGDSAHFQVMIENSYSGETDWYMSNEVIQSLEDASQTASGGAYSYILTYTDFEGSVTTLYNSDTVGGENYFENLEGLHEATNALSDFFYLDSLKKDESGTVNLYVMLDGETQGNDYQDTLAQLQMNFAVELPVQNEEHNTVEKIVYRYHDNHIVRTEEDKIINIVKTGDETNLVPLLIIAGILGLLLLTVGIIGVRLRKQMKGVEK